MKRRILRVVAGILLIGGFGAVGPASPADAAPASICTTRYCGGVVTNNVHAGVYVTNCWPSSNPVTWRGPIIKCGDANPKDKLAVYSSSAYHAYYTLGFGDSTINYFNYYDTDGFRVDQGCTLTAFDGAENLTWNNHGNTSSLWVKISSAQRIQINSIVC